MGGGGGALESRVDFGGVGGVGTKGKISRFQMSRGWHLCKWPLIGGGRLQEVVVRRELTVYTIQLSYL